jgi:hypothetical protein
VQDCEFDLGGLQLRGHGQRVALKHRQFRAADQRDDHCRICVYVGMFDYSYILLVELFGGSVATMESKAAGCGNRMN